MGSLSVDSTSQHAVANIFNSAIAASSIAAAWEVGLLDAVHVQKEVHLAKFARSNDLDLDSTQGLAVALATAHVLVLKSDDQDPEAAAVSAGSFFAETFRTKSLFHWLTQGSGGLFSRMPNALRNAERQKEGYYRRDGAAIAYACREANRQFFDPAFWAAMSSLDDGKYEVRSAVDLGCGSGERLMQILDRYPGATAVGVDLSASAIQLAENEAQRRGYSSRLAFAVDDARAMQPRADFEKVDILTCFLMGHDFWPRDECIKSLRTLRQVFPNLYRFFLCDTTRGVLPSTRGVSDGKASTVVHEGEVPIFSLGFEFGHALMGAYIPTIKEWHEVFAEGGWRCVKQHNIPNLAFNVLFELAPLE